MAVFARRASGLVRQAGLKDAWIFGFMGNGIGEGLWYIFACGYYAFPGANLFLATIIMATLSVIGFGVVYGILGSSMPRSGGDYVYNSRIIHPAIGSAANWTRNILPWTYSAVWIGEVGVPMLVGLMGWPWEIALFWSSPMGMFLGAIIVLVLAYLISIKGLGGGYLPVMKVLFVVGMIGVFGAGILVSMTSHETFVSVWNAAAVEHNSLNYDQMIQSTKAAGFPMPDPGTWSWPATMGSTLVIGWNLIYCYIICMIGGEVKRPRRNLLIATVLTVLVPAAFQVWFTLVMPAVCGYQFLHAASYSYMEGLAGYNMPWYPTYVNLAGLLTNNMILRFLMGINFWCFTFLYIPYGFIQFSRAFFAMGMDNIGPRWFTHISVRYSQPLKLLSLCFVLSIFYVGVYSFLGPGFIVVSPMIATSVLTTAITMVACTFFPYVKKVRSIWEASPSKWRIAGIPVATLAGLVGLFTTGLLTWGDIMAWGLSDVTIMWTLIYGAIWVAGIFWYFYWRSVRAKEGIDVTLAFKELPPE